VVPVVEGKAVGRRESVKSIGMREWRRWKCGVGETRLKKVRKSVDGKGREWWEEEKERRWEAGRLSDARHHVQDAGRKAESSLGGGVELGSSTARQGSYFFRFRLTR
jgi:hypothetical protein